MIDLIYNALSPSGTSFIRTSESLFLHLICFIEKNKSLEHFQFISRADLDDDTREVLIF